MAGFVLTRLSFHCVSFSRDFPLKILKNTPKSTIVVNTRYVTSKVKIPNRIPPVSVKPSDCQSVSVSVSVKTSVGHHQQKMADVPIDCDFPVWGLLPKKETGVVSFLSKNPTYDGRDTIIAIFDSGVDPAASGLKVTSTGETKVIERFDCSGCGDVDTSTVVTGLTDGALTGLTGRKLAVPSTWTNPSGKWRLGLLYPYSLYPTKLKERIQEHRREKLWDVCHKPAFAKANKELQDFESEHASSTTLTAEEKLLKEELEARVEVLQAADKKFTDLGPAYDCVLFHDGTVWRACIDNTEDGDLSKALVLGDYSVTKEHSHLTDIDEMTVSINVHNDGDTLEVVGMCSSHGTHVAAIAAGYFPDEPEKNGVAPGAKIISLTIGDSRLGSMETGTALVRACIKIMELSSKMKIDVINMSYGEHAHWSNAGRLGEVMCAVVGRYGVSWVVSAGNHGPALGTVGAPPDIHKSLHIGVGAYVSPEMMAAAYSMRAKIAGGAFSWSSRGPAADGAAGVSLCAPGGAVACVARFTLRNSQLMNGTSMAAPHVAGAVAALISGLKAKSLPYSPFSIKRALENSASYLGHVEPWAQGAGLLNIEKAFEILSTYHDQPERDVTFNLQCGNSSAKGVLLRPRRDDPPKDVGVTVEPMFVEKHDEDKSEVIKKQIVFRMKLALACSAPWVSVAAHLDMMNAPRPLSLRFDTSNLPPGPHFTSINAYDVTCVEKGPVFRIPITVFQPEPLKNTPSYPSIIEENIIFKPSTIKRHFVEVPAEATWAVLKLVSKDKDKSGRFLIHTMQMVPHRSCRCHETQKMINVTAEAPTYLPFKLVGEVLVEVVIAKYWANPGEMPVDYSIEFRGLKPDFGSKLTLHAGAAARRVALRSLRAEDVQPSIQLKHSESVLRPSDSKLSPLTARDVIPPARQIYQLINTYNFHLAKGTEVSPQVSLLCDMLYESEFESQMWMLYNSCKQLMAVGDAYPSKYSVKLEKGDYVLRVCVRHDNKQLLDKLQDMPVTLQQRLPQPLTLDVYGSQALALTGGKKFNTATLVSGQILPLYIAPAPNDKISRSNITLGQTLTGTATFARDELGRKVDTYDVQYVLCEPPKKNSAKDKEKGKPHEEYMEALKELKTNWLGKLEGDKLEQVYEELLAAQPGFVGAHVAYLNGLDSPTDPTKLPGVDLSSELTPAQCEQIISIADKVISTLSPERLLAYLGIKNDTRPDAAKIKAENEKQRGYLIDALCRKGTALCRLLAKADDANREKLTISLKENMAELLKFTDLTDSKVIHYGIWHFFALKHWGRAVKLLTKLQEDRPSRDVDERFIAACEQLQWRHLAGSTTEATATKYPVSYRGF